MVESDQEKKTQRREEFKVTDRRHFTAAGERRQGVEEDAEETGSPQPVEAHGTEETSQRSGPEFERQTVEEPEGVDFTMLVNAMAQPALFFLGEIPNPSTGESSVDLEQARLQIDMLGLLGVKCRGNLTAQEEKLLDRVLYQLRMLYVARTGKPS